MAHAPVLYRETRLTPAPASPAHILNIDTSGSASSRTSLLRAGSKRSFDEISGVDEETYTRKHLATDGSVFFRARERSPRSFLWRVLDDRKLLELQAVDLVKERTHENGDSWLTFHVGFKDATLKNGVAFADPEEQDALECFVLTEGRELLTISLRRDLLTKANVPSEFDASTCVKSYSSNFLSVRHPYRFTAISSTSLLISLADGGLVKLERKANESGSQWRETFFSEGGWRGTLTLKGLNPFAGRATVRHGDLELHPTAIADMAQSPDGKYVWTVGLDHYLRAWSTATGRVVHKQDLLNQDRRDDGRQPYLMAAEQGRLLQVLSTPRSGGSEDLMKTEEEGMYAIIVNSPRNHQFKIYNVSYTVSVDGEGVDLQDIQSTNRLAPPVEELLNTNIWQLEHFHFKPGDDWRDTQIWIRVRNGALCKVFTITLDLLDEDGVANDVRDTWATAWSSVDDGPLTVDALKHCADFPGEIESSVEDATTPSERWLAFLFSPGRFTRASLETALHTYRRVRGLTSQATASRGLKTADVPLEERLTAAICGKVLLRRLQSEQPDYERYQRDLQAQWQTFYSILSDLHAKRHEILASAFDEEDSLPWTVCADFVAPLRALRGPERRCANLQLLDGDFYDRVDSRLFSSIFPMSTAHSMEDEEGMPGQLVYRSKLLNAARQLRSALSPAARMKMKHEVEREALTAAGEHVEDGSAASLFNKLQLAEEISEDDAQTLTENVGPLGGLGELNSDELIGVIEWLNESAGRSGRDLRLRLARYGVDMTINAAREMLEEARDILLDMLTLTIFMGGDFDASDLREDFNPDEVYSAILTHLRKNNLLLWLISNVRETVVKTTDTSGASEEQTGISEVITLLEDVFIGDWESTELINEDGGLANKPDLLTFWTQRWLRGPDIDARSWNGVTTHILARLVRAKETDLATDFLRFMDRDTAWSVYVHGRLQLELGDYTQAAIHFKQAVGQDDQGDGLDAVDIESYDTAHLLLPHEKALVGNGLAAYYQHVTALFDKPKAYSYVAEFAALALEHTESLKDYTRMMAAIDKRKAPDSPALDRLDATQEENRLLRIKETRDELTNRLFSARMITGRFGEAYDALKDIRDQPLKRSGLKKLLDACIKQDCVAELLALPFDGDLLQEADKALLDLAKKGLASGTSTIATPYFQILYAFRTQRSDFRGASEILFEHLERLRNLPAHHHSHDPEDETLMQAYVLLINTLACCGEEDAWLLAEPGEGRKRKLVTLADVRREYTAELDKRSDILQGRFPLVAGGDEMDVL